MSRLAWGFALVALGHLIYVPGSIDPITASAVSDVITTILLGTAAWRSRDAAGSIPRGVVPILLVLGPLEIVDYLLSFGSGWQSFHAGFTLVLAGALVVSWGAWRMRQGEEGARAVRLGAWLGAAGSLVYAILAAEPYLFGGPTSPPFLLGATSALAGWSTVALAAQGSWPSGGSTNP